MKNCNCTAHKSIMLYFSASVTDSDDPAHLSDRAFTAGIHKVETKMKDPFNSKEFQLKTCILMHLIL